MTADATNAVKKRSMVVSEKRTCARTENRAVQEERRAFQEAVIGWTFPMTELTAWGLSGGSGRVSQDTDSGNPVTGI